MMHQNITAEACSEQQCQQGSTISTQMVITSWPMGGCASTSNAYDDDDQWHQLEDVCCCPAQLSCIAPALVGRCGVLDRLYTAEQCMLITVTARAGRGHLHAALGGKQQAACTWSDE